MLDTLQILQFELYALFGVKPEKQRIMGMALPTQKNIPIFMAGARLVIDDLWI